MKSIVRLALVSTIVLSALQSASAAVIVNSSTPYTDDFSTPASGNGNNLVTNTSPGSSSGTWQVNGGRLQTTLTAAAAGGTYSTDLLQVTGLTNPNSFVISSTVQMSTLPTGNFNVGLDLFGVASNLPNNFNGTGYLAVVSQNGALTLGQFTNSSGHTFTSLGTPTGTVATVTNSLTYTLTLTGTYSGGQLFLNFSVFDGTNTASVASAGLTPLTGTWFGYEARMANPNTTMTANFDNLSIALVPEPSAASLAPLALIGLAGLARRRPSQA